MTPRPAPGPGRDEDPARHARGPGDPLQDEAAGWRRLPSGATDWMDDEQWAARPLGEEPELYPDPEDRLLPGEVDLDALIAECREITAAEAQAAAVAARLGTTGALGAIAATAGRRGPGQPGVDPAPSRSGVCAGGPGADAGRVGAVHSR